MILSASRRTDIPNYYGEWFAQRMKEEAMVVMAGRMAEIAQNHGIEVASCGEAIDLSSCGVSLGSCIDKRLVEQLAGCPIRVEKDRNQRRTSLDVVTEKEWKIGRR